MLIEDCRSGGLRPRSFYAVVAYWRKTQVVSPIGWLQRHHLPSSVRSHNERLVPSFLVHRSFRAHLSIASGDRMTARYTQKESPSPKHETNRKRIAPEWLRFRTCAQLNTSFAVRFSFAESLNGFGIHAQFPRAKKDVACVRQLL